MITTRVIVLIVFHLGVAMFADDVLGLILSRFAEKPRTTKAPDDVVYHSSSASGTVESIHIGGRTEVVRVTGTRLTKCSAHSKATKWGRETCLWRLDADIEQPEGRKNYFAPHLDGMVDVKQKSGQLTEHGERPWDAMTNMCVGWDQLRCANIVFKDDKPVSVRFFHMKFIDGEWVVAAEYIAHFKDPANFKRVQHELPHDQIRQ